MSYEYRCRVYEYRNLFGRRRWAVAVEQRFITWTLWKTRRGFKSEANAQADATWFLDSLERVPGEYVGRTTKGSDSGTSRSV